MATRMALNMAHVLLNPLAIFDRVSEPTTLSHRWQAWKGRLQTYITAMGITENKQKRALLLYQEGSDTQYIFDTFSDNREEDDYELDLQKLNHYLGRKKHRLRNFSISKSKATRRRGY